MFAITTSELPQKRKYNKKKEKDNRGRRKGQRNVRHNLRHKKYPLVLSEH